MRAVPRVLQVGAGRLTTSSHGGEGSATDDIEALSDSCINIERLTYRACHGQLYFWESEVTLTGECFCGDIKYQINGPLRDATSCHCSRCRKAFSSQASVYALVEPDDFQWLSGQYLLTSYVGEQGFGLQFCSRCGSTLCGVFDGAVHGVTLGCLNEDPAIDIAKHIYVGSKANWEIIPEGVVQFKEGKS